MSEEQIQQTEKKCNCNRAVALISIAALFISIISFVLSTYTLVSGATPGEGKKVVISKQYDKGQSLEKALATNKPVLVFFYTDWCGFCQRFVPTYNKIAKLPKIKKNFAVAYVNCENESNKKTVEEYQIHAFPTVYVIDKEGKRTQLDNNTFFNEDSREVVSKKALELIGVTE